MKIIRNLVPRAFSLAWGKGPGNEVDLYVYRYKLMLTPT